MPYKSAKSNRCPVCIPLGKLHPPAGQATDFYYGDLPNELVANGFSAAIALINHTGQPGKPLAEKWKECLVPRMIFSRSLGLREEIANMRHLRRESFGWEDRRRAVRPVFTSVFFSRHLGRHCPEHHRRSCVWESKSARWS